MSQVNNPTIDAPVNWEQIIFRPRPPPPDVPSDALSSSPPRSSPLRPIDAENSIEEVSWRMSIFDINDDIAPMAVDSPAPYPEPETWTIGEGNSAITYGDIVPMITDAQHPYPTVLYPPVVPSHTAVVGDTSEAGPSTPSTSQPTSTFTDTCSIPRPRGQPFVYILGSAQKATNNFTANKPFPQLPPEEDPWAEPPIPCRFPPPVAYDRWAHALKNTWWNRIHKASCLDEISEADEEEERGEEREGEGQTMDMERSRRSHSV